MPFKQKIKTYTEIARRIPKRYYAVVGVLAVALLYVMAFRERTVVYNYAGETCDNRFVVLPGLFQQPDSASYKIVSKGGLSLLGKQVTATSLCIYPNEAPAEKSSKVVSYAPLGGWLARFNYKIKTSAYPRVNTSALEKKPVPVSRDLLLPLSQPDTTFKYALAADKKKSDCESEGSRLSCDLPSLKLKQGAKYTLTLEKRFNDQKLGKAANATIETLSPVAVTESSIQKDATIYDKPGSVVITADKPLKQAEFIAQRIDGEEPVSIGLTSTVENEKAIITFAEELPRQAKVELKATKFEADDGSTLLEPYSLTFETSGGPKVTGVNVSSSGVAIGSQIVVTFDQELSADQDIAPLVAMTGGITLQARSGNQLIFSTANAGLCQDISITFKSDIKSPYDISGQSAWEYRGRTQCYTVRTIGYSVKGRAINAFQFGSGGSAIIYTGAIHGNEVSTKSLMDRWIQELDANPGKIPADKRIIIVPTINPDGVAAGTRVNARNVDLNRNFSTGDWKKDIQHVNGSAFPGGGGEEPMSEPETKAIAGFIADQRPVLVVSYHSIGGLVISNQYGQADSRAGQYASLSGYRLSGGGGGEFGYEISGTADDYYREKLGVSSILIELGSHSYHQFERNQSAMWAALQ